MNTRRSIGHTIMDGCRWGTKKELTAFRFQIVHPKGTPSCSVEDLAEIWQLLKKVGLTVTHMSQQCDKDTHCSEFTVQAQDGQVQSESELRFVQEAIFEELKGVGAHLIFLPAMHALQSTCKLARVTVIADALCDGKTATGGAQTSMNCMYDIVCAVVTKSFYVMRGAVQLHGQSLMVELLIGHEKGLDSLGSEGEKNPLNALDASLTAAELARSHSHLGAAQLPDISEAELDELKARLDNSIPGRISTIVDPLTYARGPVGGMQYDFKTLIATQDDELPACEIRFQFDSFPHSALTAFMSVLSKDGNVLISATFDERAEQQMNVVLAKKDLTQAYEEQLLQELAAAAKHAGIRGLIDLANLNNPMEKRFVSVDNGAPTEASPAAPVAAAPVLPPSESAKEGGGLFL